MRQAEAMGMEGLFVPPPELLPAVARAVHCWHTCGGWKPEALPLYDALYGVDDWEMLFALSETLRNELNR